MKKKRFKIAVSGATETSGASLETLAQAKKLGEAVAKRGHFLVTGAHHGFPMFSAIGAKESGGDVIYFSPASSEQEHKEAYRMDTDHADVIIYTGFGHAGSNIFLARSADAVIIGMGKVDALHEFDVARKAGKPVGVLHGDWEIDAAIKQLAQSSHQPIVFENDPDKLVDRLLELIIKQ